MKYIYLYICEYKKIFVKKINIDRSSRALAKLKVAYRHISRPRLVKPMLLAFKCEICEIEKKNEPNKIQQ